MGGRETGERDTGQQEARQDRNGQYRTAGGGTGGQDRMTVDRETDSGSMGEEDRETGGLKRDFHSHSHGLGVHSPLKQRRPTTLAAGLLIVLCVK